MSDPIEKDVLVAHRNFVHEHRVALFAALERNQTTVAIARALIKAEIPVHTEALRAALTDEFGPVA